jgi:catalase (peroxidase I)
MGLSPSEMVALTARPSKDMPDFSNRLFKTLLMHEWQPADSDSKLAEPLTAEYESEDGQRKVKGAEAALTYDPELMHYVQVFADDEAALKATFAGAWTKLMNADRFNGPDGNVCYSH